MGIEILIKLQRRKFTRAGHLLLIGMTNILYLLTLNEVLFANFYTMIETISEICSGVFEVL